MKKRWFVDRKQHLDQQKIDAKRKALRDLTHLLDHNDLNGYLAYVALLKKRPLTEAEKEQHTKLFYEKRSEHPNDA